MTKREDFIASMEDIDPKNIVVIDESGSDLSMTSDYARVEGGDRAGHFSKSLKLRLR